MNDPSLFVVSCCFVLNCCPRALRLQVFQHDQPDPSDGRLTTVGVPPEHWFFGTGVDLECVAQLRLPHSRTDQKATPDTVEPTTHYYGKDGVLGTSGQHTLDIGDGPRAQPLVGPHRGPRISWQPIWTLPRGRHRPKELMDSIRPGSILGVHRLAEAKARLLGAEFGVLQHASDAVHQAFFGSTVNVFHALAPFKCLLVGLPAAETLKQLQAPGCWVVERVPRAGQWIDSRFLPECASLPVNIIPGASRPDPPGSVWLPFGPLRPVYPMHVSGDEVANDVARMKSVVCSHS